MRTNETNALTALGINDTDTVPVKLAALQHAVERLETLADPAAEKAAIEADARDLDASHPAGPMQLSSEMRQQLLDQAKDARRVQGRTTRHHADIAARLVGTSVQQHLDRVATLPSESEQVRQRHTANPINEFLSDDSKAQRAQQNNIEWMLARQLEATDVAAARQFLRDADGNAIVARYLAATPDTDRAFMRLVEAERPNLTKGAEVLEHRAWGDALASEVARRRGERLAPADRALRDTLQAMTRRLKMAGANHEDTPEAAADRIFAGMARG